MYLTAHRVVSPSTKEEGINAFYYTHGNYVWEGRPPLHLLPDNDPGVLVKQSVAVSPPGNRVRSFLDLVAPETCTAQTLARRVEAIREGDAPASFPAEWNVEQLWLRLGLEQVLTPFWRQELWTLAERAIALLPR